LVRYFWDPEKTPIAVPDVRNHRGSASKRKRPPLPKKSPPPKKKAAQAGS